MKKHRMRNAVTVLSLVLSAVVIGTVMLMYYFVRGNEREQSDDITKYRQWALSDYYTHFLIFPETIPKEAEQVEYYYQYESGWNRPMCQIYLSYRLDEEAYREEEERLAGLSWESDIAGLQTVQKDLKSFRYPAYVTIAGYDFCYEYALLYEQKHEIVYIYVMNTVEEDLDFNVDFLPADYMEGFDDLSVSGRDRFNMYGGYESSVE